MLQNNRPLFRTQSTSSIVPTYHTREENLLRRKTPNGTLPAAYEAAPVEFMPRPTKQILLPYQEEARLLHNGNQGMAMNGWDGTSGPATDSLAQLGMDASNGAGPIFPVDWSTQQNGMPIMEDAMRQFLFQQQQMVPPFIPDALWSNCQYSGFQPMYNPITPPTASSDEVNAYLLGTNYNPIPRDSMWQNHHAVAWGSGQSTPSAQLPQGVININLNGHYSEPLDQQSHHWSQPQPFSNYLPSPIAIQPSQAELQLRSMYDGTVYNGSAQNTNVLLSREKAAAWAHKAYVDLLSSIHAQKRQNAAAQGNTSHRSGMSNLYPRPPKYMGSALKTTQLPQGSSASRYSAHPQTAEMLDRRKRLRASIGGSTSYLDLGTLSHQTQPNSAYPFPVQVEQQLHITRRHSAAAAAGYALDNEQRMVTPITPVNVAGPVQQATAALRALEKLCAESAWAWTDGMLLGGCLSFGLGDLNSSLGWYRRILDIDANNVEALSNYASTLLSVGRRQDAEKHWQQAVKSRPNYFEAVEHLVGLFCGEQRTQEAVDIINYVETSLRSEPFPESILSLGSVSSDGSFGSEVSNMEFEYEDADHDNAFGASQHKRASASSGFAIPGSDNGRMLALIHAKGNMLYSLGDNVAAAKAFEDAVLLAAGIQKGGIEALINKILIVLKAATDGVNLANQVPPQGPVLLPPDRAVQTARLVFPPNGDLPGLKDVAQGFSMKMAVSTTSNSLLSLAKIFQDGMSSGSVALGRSGCNVKDILALYYLSLSLHASPSTANNVGILLASIQGSSTPSNNSRPLGVDMALQYYGYGLGLDNKHAHLYTNLGSLLKDINKLPDAIAMYERAVNCDPNFDIALANLANAVKDQGRISDAIGYYRRAVESNPNFAEAVCGLANALNSVCDWKGRGGVVRDGGIRDRWHVDENGMLVDATAVGTLSSGWMKRVVGIVDKQLLQGEAWGKHTLMGETLNRFIRDIAYAEDGHVTDDRYRQLRAAIEQWSQQPYEGAKIIRLIERASRRTTWRWYQDKYIRGINNYPRSEYRRPAVPAALTTPSAPTVLPFHTFTCPLSSDQVRQISERNALRISVSTLRSSWISPTVYPPPAPPAPYLCVGYVSSDFNNHPLAHLMQSVFGLHDVRRVKAYCYATTASDGSIHRQQIEREAPVFYDAHSWPPERLIQQIVSDGIHILVNLNGFTRGARNEVFAARPAPIQMSFMGFAGTLGAEWCDYLYADETAVPKSMLRKHRGNATVDDALTSIQEWNKDKGGWVYGENLMFARYSFFCCDHKQSAPDSGRHSTWEQEKRRRWEMRKRLFPDIKDDTVILANFNQLYKIDPLTLRLWLRILSQLPNSILWLLRFPDLGERNLLHQATLWSSPEIAARIRFTDVAPKPQHIDRAKICDLFLDTPECNAHTTAADVLWSGTPILTVLRREKEHKMAGRVGGSVVNGAAGGVRAPRRGEGEWKDDFDDPAHPSGIKTEDEVKRPKSIADRLITHSCSSYESRAVELASSLVYTSHGQGSGELLEIRRRLWEARWGEGLFDTARWVRDLEVGYEEVWKRWERGEGGGDVEIKDLVSGMEMMGMTGMMGVAEKREVKMEVRGI
ncbi:UDP-N-acetylglucosaminyltransferase [Pyronema domesticum]|nr:UDP-N-acetylglucosaminyltransferase [Pyronema domesticum]